MMMNLLNGMIVIKDTGQKSQIKKELITITYYKTYAEYKQRELNRRCEMIKRN